ncbi:MAG TPA: hypothetical protein VGU02_11395 [Gaiellaceae bacterium]|nr:hypothetical protein [Gaiellaceae bacterium]
MRIRLAFLLWAFGSAIALTVAVFGPWLTFINGKSQSWTDNGHGWLVLTLSAFAAIALLAHSIEPRWWKGALPMICGTTAFAVTLYDRHVVLGDRQSGDTLKSLALAFYRAFVAVGWGVTVALYASGSLAIAGLAILLTDRFAHCKSQSGPQLLLVECSHAERHVELVASPRADRFMVSLLIVTAGWLVVSGFGYPFWPSSWTEVGLLDILAITSWSLMMSGISPRLIGTPRRRLVVLMTPLVFLALGTSYLVVHLAGWIAGLAYLVVVLGWCTWGLRRMANRPAH